MWVSLTQYVVWNQRCWDFEVSWGLGFVLENHFLEVGLTQKLIDHEIVCIAKPTTTEIWNAIYPPVDIRFLYFLTSPQTPNPKHLHWWNCHQIHLIHLGMSHGVLPYPTSAITHTSWINKTFYGHNSWFSTQPFLSSPPHTYVYHATSCLPLHTKKLLEFSTNSMASIEPLPLPQSSTKLPHTAIRSTSLK